MTGSKGFKGGVKLDGLYEYKKSFHSLLLKKVLIFNHWKALKIINVRVPA